MKKNLGKKILVNGLAILFCLVLAFFSQFLFAAIIGEGTFLDLLSNCLGINSICNSIYDGSIGAENSAAAFSLISIFILSFAICILIYVKFIYSKIKI